MGGGSEMHEASNRLGLPAELIQESEVFQMAEVGIYPDNMPAVALFADMRTQWRVGPCGPIGLDYLALPVVFRLRRVPVADRTELFDDLRVMERAALNYLRQVDQ